MDNVEREQLDRVMGWWRQSGKTVIRFALLAAVVYGAWVYWQHHADVQKTRASDTYVMMLYAQQEGEKETVQLRAKELMDEFPSMNYASAAALVLSKMAFDEGRHDDALSHLNWVAESYHGEFSDLARLRMARLYLNNKDAVSALDKLKSVKTTTFLSMQSELMGDAYVLEGKKDLAIQSYKTSLDLDDLGSDSRVALVQMKLADLGVAFEPKHHTEN
ncbi:MAG: tetratricopeptide repeat protein [Pseudomonadota bacterium]